jgi:hypothetical protein
MGDEGSARNVAGDRVGAGAGAGDSSAEVRGGKRGVGVIALRVKLFLVAWGEGAWNGCCC